MHVALGEPGSGSAAHGRQILRLLGLPDKRLAIDQLSLRQALEALERRQIDLVFVTSAVPNPLISKAAAVEAVSLFELDPDLARSLRRSGPFFTAAEIPFGAYPGMTASVATVGTQALLVARTEVPEAAVKELLEAVHAVTAGAVESPLPFLAGIDPGAGIEDSAIPAHPAAAKFWSARRNPWRRVERWIRTYLLPVLILFAPLLVLLRMSRVAFFLYRFDLLRILVVLLAVWLMGASAMYLIEGAKNSSFRSFGRSAVAILHYLFSGLEAKYPITVAGNVVSILILTLGVAIATVFTATLVKLLVERALNVRHLRPKPSSRFHLQGHTLIVGWSPRSERIVRQLRSEDLRFRDPIVVVADHRAETQLGGPRDLRNLWLVEGDPGQEVTLRRCDVTSARTALVLCEPTLDGKGELGCLAAVLAIDRLAPQVHTVVEATAPATLEHLAACRVDEVVDTSLLADRLLSQALITPGIVSIYDELLSFGRESQEIYAVEVPPELDGKTFRETVLTLRKAEVLPLGFWAGDAGKPRLNPSAARYGTQGSREYRLRAGGDDRLLLMADERWVLRSHFRKTTWRRFNPWSRRLSMDENPDTPQASPPPPRRENHIRDRRIAFCGWNDQAPDVIRQLQEQVVEARQRFHIKVVTDRLTEKSLGKKGPEVYKNVSFVFGDPTRQEVLASAGLAEMDGALILAEGVNGEGNRCADHRSLMVALAARAVQEDLHLVAQVLESRHQEHFRRIPNLEIVSLEDLAEKLLAQAAISPGISAVYHNLLTATSDTNEIYVVPVPPVWVGRSFQKLYLELMDNGEEVVLLGYATPREPDTERVVVLNPRQRKGERHGVVDWRGYELQPQDRLVVLAYEQPDW